jgi:flavodoxin
MKIGIIVFSFTGHTYSVAEKIKQGLLSKGCSVNLERVEIEGDKYPSNGVFEFKTVPTVDKYDFLIFGSPVEGFMLSKVMEKYLNQITSLEKKKIACFVTQTFPYPWLGGNSAIKQMKRICEKKGAIIVETGIVNWSNKKRNEMIENVANNFVNYFKDVIV